MSGDRGDTGIIGVGEMESQAYLGGVLSYVQIVIDRSIGLLFQPGHFLSLGPLAMALLIGTLVLLYHRRARPASRIRLSPRRLLKILFPRAIFLHRSAKADYAVVLINEGLLFFLTFAAITTPVLFSETLAALFERFGIQTAVSSAGLAEQIIYTIVLVLAWDFSASYAHYLKHKIPWFWEFHKVHHCAEVVTPVTALRRHPIDSMISAAITTVFLGVVIALWHLVLGRGIEPLTIFGSYAGIYLWRLFGYNLRHTHIWISYGDFWNQIFISPAQHQVHHSIDPKHYDTNFGHIFAFWDRIFGTLYLPRHDERVIFGIEPDEMADFRTLGDLYFRPFKNLGGRVAVAVLGRSAR